MKHIRSKPRFLILEVINPQNQTEWVLNAMAEAEQLVKTYGGDIITKEVQHRVKPHPNTYVGTGKVEWLLQTVKDQEIDVVVVNNIVNSGQLFRLEKALWKVNTRIKVWDRVDLILNIFELHAKSTEAKLQIELARIQHAGPRIFGLGGTELSRQGAGIGTRGLGETNIEKERRLIKDRTRKLKKELKKLSKRQHQRIQQRQQQGMKTVALVGYTSAGKTTLFNQLTHKKKQTNQQLFTTLESVVGRIEGAPSMDEVLVSDTIGFIENLPPFLVETFRSTLFESLEATVVLHVIDASDPHMTEKIRAVEEILDDVGVEQARLFVFNKLDLVEAEELEKLRAQYPEAAFVSAQMGDGVEELVERVVYWGEKPVEPTEV